MSSRLNLSVSDLANPGHAAGFLAVFTLVLWLGWLTIGLLGFILPYARPRRAVPTQEPVKFERLIIELSQEPLSDSAPASTPATEPPDPLNLPRVPMPVPVAQPSPAVAFALPVAGPVRIVEARQATYARSEPASATVPVPTAQLLTFGQGEGKQPGPEYPPRALREGLEGSVLVHMIVGVDGRVISAEAALPSPWAILNEAAVRTVRERWRFSPGKLRAYNVAIRFELTN